MSKHKPAEDGEQADEQEETTYADYREDMEAVGLAPLSGRVQKAPAVVEARLLEQETTVETREGTLNASRGDVLITGVEGEVYPCDPVIFAKTYVPRDPDSLRLFRRCVPEGVEIEYEDRGDLTVPEAVYVRDDVDLSEEQREAAEEFVEDYLFSFPFLHPNP